jgi:hypothetical protein
MRYKNYRIFKTQFLLLAICVVMIYSCNNNEPVNKETPELTNVVSKNFKSNPNEQFAVEPPPFSDGIYPCTDCHANFPPNPKRRKLTEWHEDISAMFNHDSENRWCLDCHDLNNRDSLRLASGKLLDFKESYKLCGQCHGEKYRDWKVGVHGKRTGYWDGKKEYLLCVSCHNPHSPKFPLLTPEPPPVKQEDIK